jgi:hemerythrin-like domain-containing protein
MRAYAELLRNHISKENNILFRMADKTLSEDEQQNLLAEFGILEKVRPTGKRPTDYIDRINTLASFYKVQ